MKFGKILIFVVILSMAVSLCACKSRTGGRTEKQDESESAEISENPRVEENSTTSLPPVSQSQPEEDRAPYELAESFLKAAKTGERAAIQSYVDYNTLFKLQEGQNPDWILQQMLLRMKYEIISRQTEDDSALVSVTFTNVDMGTVMPLYYQQAMALEFENALSDAPKDSAQLEKEYQRIFAGLISKHGESRIEKPADVELKKEDGNWQIKATSALGNAMLGGYIDAQGKFTEAVQAAAASQAAAESQAAEQLQMDDPPGYADGEESMVAPRE